MKNERSAQVVDEGVGEGEKRKEKSATKLVAVVTTAGGQSSLQLPQSHDLSLFRRSEFSLPSISPSILSGLQTNLSAQTPRAVVEPKFAHKQPDTCPCEWSFLGPRPKFAPCKDDRSLDQLEI